VYKELLQHVSEKEWRKNMDYFKDKLGLNYRVASRLSWHFKSIDEVRDVPDHVLLSIPDFGKGSLREVRDLLHQSPDPSRRIAARDGLRDCSDLELINELRRRAKSRAANGATGEG